MSHLFDPESARFALCTAAACACLALPARTRKAALMWRIAALALSVLALIPLFTSPEPGWVNAILEPGQITIATAVIAWAGTYMHRESSEHAGVGGMPGVALAALGCAAFAAFAVFTVAANRPQHAYVDDAVAAIAERFPIGHIRPVADGLAELGSPTGSAVLLAALLVFFVLRGRLAAALIMAGATAAFVMVEGVLRVRLDQLDASHLPGILLHPHGYHLIAATYPSGHVGRFLVVAGCALAFARRYRAGMALAVLCLAAIIGLQRVASGSHSGTDVVGGGLLGIALAALALSAIASYEGRLSRTSRPSPGATRALSSAQRPADPLEQQAGGQP